jgi:hypothetical protein
VDQRNLDSVKDYAGKELSRCRQGSLALPLRKRRSHPLRTYHTIRMRLYPSATVLVTVLQTLNATLALIALFELPKAHLKQYIRVSAIP